MWIAKNKNTSGLYRKKIFLILLFCSQILLATAQKAVNTQPLVIGQIQTLHSAILKEDRILNIYLPQQYDSTKAYPVLYLLDGSMDEDFMHIAGLTQFFNLMYQMPECIVVGIANVDRKRDFTFHTDLKDLQKKYPTTGHSAAFIDFIEKELQPFINSTYKTGPVKYLVGQSLGGLVATEILLKRPQLFSHYFIISPSLWWDNESLLNKAPSLIALQPDEEKYVYISVGKKEENIMQKDARALYQLIEKANRKKTSIYFKLMEDEDHATILHRSIYQAFLLLFPPRY